MTIYEKYADLKVQSSSVSDVKRRYSVTADILSFRRCPRQYASLTERGFSPSGIG